MTDRECNNCNESDWRTAWKDEYESGRERAIKICRGCDAEARVFSGNGEATVYSGAMR